jgi:hypothetical protein
MGRSGVVVGGNLGAVQSILVGAPFLSKWPAGQAGTITLPNGNSSAQVWQAKGSPAVTTVNGSEDRKKGTVLRNGHQLTFTKCPASWSEIARKNSDFSYKSFHIFILFNGQR